MAVKLRGALLGSGNIALRGHAPQWLGDPALASEVEIVAVADLSAENLEAAHGLFPAARTYSSAKRLLEDEALDFVDICTPPSTHAPLIEQATARGLHLVCEKPLASTYAEAEHAAACVRDAGVVFRPCHQYHYSPLWQATRALLPRIGPIHLVEYQVHRTAANQGSAHWTPHWRTRPDLAGGGILVDHGAHIFYQLLSVLGPPQSIQAMVRRLQHRTYEVEDTALVTLDFGAAVAQLTLTWASRRRAVEFRFVGEHGEVVGDDTGVRLVADDRAEVVVPEGMSGDSAHSGWYAPLFREFTAAVRQGDKGTTALDEAVEVARLINYAYESSQERCALTVVNRGAAGRPTEAVGTGAPMVDVVPAPGAARPNRGFGRVWLLRGAVFASLVGAAFWSFHDVAWRGLWGAVASADLSWIFLAATVNLVVLLFHSLRWFALVRPLSRTASVWHTLNAMTVGFAVSTIVPARAGELARMEWLRRHTGIPRLAVISSIVLDHLVNASGLLLGIALLPLFVTVPLWMRPGGWLAFGFFALGVGAVWVLHSLSRGQVVAPESSLFSIKRVAATLATARKGVMAIQSPRSLLASYGASAVAWGLEINVTALSMRAVGLRLPLSASILVLVAVNLALALPIAPPGNLGTLELAATLALVGLGVGKEQALAFALCYHLLQIIPIGLLGLLVASGATGGRESSWAAAAPDR